METRYGLLSATRKIVSWWPMPPQETLFAMPLNLLMRAYNIA